MPRMDGTGPMGKGAMTGRGNGNCQGNQQRLGVGYGKCNRNGNGQGMGFGFRHGQNFSSNLQPLAKDELTFLKNKANNMENNLNNVKAKISELEQSK
jgi:hypothetical protein